MTTQTSRDCPNRSISVIVPAHNEEASIGALLRGLVRDAAPGEISVVVACNGCTDRTAEIARTFGPSVTVLEIPAPSKRHAQRAGDAVARGFPRAYVDADVTTTLNDLRELAGRLEDGRILATAPARRLDTTGTDWVVTRYYRVWEQLPQVREGLFGRGVVMVSHAGAKRILEIPDVMSDDLAMSEVFAPGEREIVHSATATISVPRTARDLLRRRVRIATGNAQADHLGIRRSGTSTSWRVLVRVVRSSPSSIPDVFVFLVVALAARTASRRHVRSGDFTTWLRDESSRGGRPPNSGGGHDLSDAWTDESPHGEDHSKREQP